VEDQLNELRRDVKHLEKVMVDAQNMSIKTDNNLRSLYAELKRIADNQSRAIQSTRFHSIGVYLLLTVVLVAAAAIIGRFYLTSLKESIAACQEKREVLAGQVARLEKDNESRAAAAIQALNLYEALKQDQKEAAVRQYDQLNRAALDKAMVGLFDDRILAIRKDLAAQHQKEGLRMYRVGNHTNAIREFNTAMTLSETFDGKDLSLYYLGFALFKEKDYQGALKALEEAVNADDKAREYPQALMTMGLAMEQGGNLEEAQRHYEKVIAQSGRNLYRSKMLMQLAALKKTLAKREKEAAAKPATPQPAGSP